LIKYIDLKDEATKTERVMNIQDMWTDHTSSWQREYMDLTEGKMHNGKFDGEKEDNVKELEVKEIQKNNRTYDKKFIKIN
jgi:hypothetical protein